LQRRCEKFLKLGYIRSSQRSSTNGRPQQPPDIKVIGTERF
jgi:hypothetical protein